MAMLMVWLVALLILDAVLHALVVYRYGVRENLAFLIFALVYAALALAVVGLLSSLFSASSVVLWITLVVTAVGLIGLTILQQGRTGKDPRQGDMGR